MRYLTITLLLVFIHTSFAQIVKTKVIDDGGSGDYKAIAVCDETLQDFVVYRPKDIRSAVKEEGKLPVLVWANGGCMNSSIHHERFLTEIASHGYVIVAIGSLQMTVEEREHEHTADDKLLQAIDWMTAQEKTRGSDYYHRVDLERVAAAGHSCGGAQTLRVADDSRIKTYMILNAGMGDMTMAGASANSLKKLHADIIYLIGGETDVAYENAILDYARIDNVPAVIANHTTAGHSATFDEEFGGAFARMALDWLDWHFKGKDKSEVFIGKDLSAYPNWTIRSKGFDREDDEVSGQDFVQPQLEFTCELKVSINQALELGKTPKGERIIIPISGGTFKGPKLQGTVLSGGADYQLLSPDGKRTELNAIYTIQTDDGVLIHVRNEGLFCAHADNDIPPYFMASPRFEAPIDSKYAWMNNAVFIAKPVGREGYVSIQVWKVL